MKDTSPSLPEWKDLYAAAVEFRDLGPWEWMYDSDLFGVRNPQNGEIGYCCVMGNLGEHFALGVYLGTEGLDGYIRIQSGTIDAAKEALLHYQKCLMASFEDREYLDKQDLAVIKSLGLKFRGRNIWPLFRSYLPDYHPWFLTSDEARFLLVALRQAIDVVQRYRDNPKLLTPPRRGQFLVRVPDEHGAQWHDEWLAPDPWQPAVNAVLVDELRIKRIRQSVTKRAGVWEADFFAAPSPIQEHKDERPYYPYMSLWVEQRTGMVLPPQMAAADVFPQEALGHFLSLIEQAQFMPQEVHVGTQDAFELLEPVTKRLGIKLRRTKRLEMLEEARESLMGFMDRL
jgi:hypothetical protein